MSPHASPLDLDARAMRELGYRVVDMLVDRHESLPAGPVWQGAARAQLAARLHETAPEAGRGFDAALDRLVHDVLPYTARIDHPRFMAFVPGAPTWPGVLGDLIAAGSNIFQGTWLASSGVSALELVVIDWFRAWLGCRQGTAGLLVSGGSAANLTALACARLARYPAHSHDAVIYCSSEAHSSVQRAARILGFADDRVRGVRVDGADRIDCSELRTLIAADRAAGLDPFLVVATAGTTSTGAIDPLPELVELCAAEETWLHIDAAYGGFAVLTERGRAALAGIDGADSITLDPHKWLYQPFEAGCLLVRDGALLERAFHILPPYLQDTALPHGSDSAAEAAREVNFADRGIQLTRSARVLKLWLSIQTFGVAAFRQTIDNCLDLAIFAEERIRAADRFELLTPARLGIVCFRRTAAGTAAERELLDRRALDELLASGQGMISSTRVRAEFALRLCILNHRTTRRDVRQILEAL
jgi:aromatic-L-amino-acid/L-tryptophan decarboxylase